MKIGESVYLGDGAYLTFTGDSFLFSANDHINPTDQVSVDLHDGAKLLHIIAETLEEHT